MTAEIGQYALILALMVSAVGGVLTLAGAELASRSWMRVGMAAAAVLAVLATIAIGALAWGCVGFTRRLNPLLGDDARVVDFCCCAFSPSSA